VNSFFDKIYCYSLEDEGDRVESSKIQFKKNNLDVEFFNAVDNRGHGLNENGIMFPHIGVNRTVSLILDLCIEKNLSNVLMFQNDVILIDDFTSVFNENIKYLPDDWDFLSLGCFNYFPPQKINGRISKTKAIVMDHAVAINSKAFKIYNDKLKKEDAESDMSICSLIKSMKLNAYSFVPYIATQGEFYSSTTCRVEKTKECD
jgi:hypothetical protein